MPDRTLFSERLSEAMARAGLKQADLIHIASQRGKKLGKSQVSQYVSGKTVPRRNVVALLADILAVDEDWLADGAATPVAHAPAAQPAPAARATARSVAAATPASSHQATSQRSTPMRQFTKSAKLDNVLYDVRGPVADEAARMEDEGLRILKLNIGNPAPFGFRTPDEVVTDMRQQLPSARATRIPRASSPRARQSCSTRSSSTFPTSRWTVSTRQRRLGAHPALHERPARHRRRDPHSEPDYPLWTACATLAGGTPVHYVCDEEAEWNPDLADLESKITSNTKAIVIINPTTPRAPSTRARCSSRSSRSRASTSS